jgi:hypothetical protein
MSDAFAALAEWSLAAVRLFFLRVAITTNIPHGRRSRIRSPRPLGTVGGCKGKRLRTEGSRSHSRRYRYAGQ